MKHMFKTIIIPAKHPNRRVLKLEVDECMVDSLTRFFKILLDSLGFFKIPSFSRFLKDSSSVSRIL